MKELENFIYLSKYAGQRFDIVQAGGGNSSVKLDHENMLIKSSGILMADMNLTFGHSKISYPKVNEVFTDAKIGEESNKKVREQLAAKHVKDAHISGGRVSIEVFLHSILGKYVLHTHPIAVNNIVIRHDAEEILARLFGVDHLFVDYRTPGIDLGICLNDTIKQVGGIDLDKLQVLFLKNHGLIISGNSYQEIIIKQEQILGDIEAFLKVDYSRYKDVGNIVEFINSKVGSDVIARLSDDIVVTQQLVSNPALFDMLPTCPDSFVFNGFVPLFLESFDHKLLDDYMERYSMPPKIIIYKNKLYFLNDKIGKTFEMEQVFKFHLLAISNSQSGQLNFIDRMELDYLNNWEAEKYRQNK
jgi:rhamnose utilization protein RhaD (predicted bifunctional aldolase and dehydrogenase)